VGREAPEDPATGPASAHSGATSAVQWLRAALEYRRPVARPCDGADQEVHWELDTDTREMWERRRGPLPEASPPDRLGPVLAERMEQQTHQMAEQSRQMALQSQELAAMREELTHLHKHASELEGKVATSDQVTRAKQEIIDRMTAEAATMSDVIREAWGLAQENLVHVRVRRHSLAFLAFFVCACVCALWGVHVMGLVWGVMGAIVAGGFYLVSLLMARDWETNDTGRPSGTGRTDDVR
jgi:hypothetical protein